MSKDAYKLDAYKPDKAPHSVSLTPTNKPRWKKPGFGCLNQLRSAGESLSF